jgi:hypothetical protein
MGENVPKEVWRYVFHGMGWPMVNIRRMVSGQMKSLPSTQDGLTRGTEGLEGGGFPESACRTQTSTRGKGLKTNGNAKDGEQSWKLATGGRFRANLYAYCKWQPSQNPSRNLFPPPRFSPTGDSAAFNGTARQPSPV